ncbi:hypothetical protein OH76DRAFT_251401 [Lentinus brumalis]|uniref:Uncharacterized protein n=1 Tax=Lentinus brumalis TaxID=2498619 RepID=A0A371CLF3_9APHY|nr:hypothetical protein OH76DRAFT_251401 [Polyporus brumalis]
MQAFVYAPGASICCSRTRFRGGCSRRVSWRAASAYAASRRVQRSELRPLPETALPFWLRQGPAKAGRPAPPPLETQQQRRSASSSEHPAAPNCFPETPKETSLGGHASRVKAVCLKSEPTRLSSFAPRPPQQAITVKIESTQTVRNQSGIRSAWARWAAGCARRQRRPARASGVSEVVDNGGFHVRKMVCILPYSRLLAYYLTVLARYHTSYLTSLPSSTLSETFRGRVRQRQASRKRSASASSALIPSELN